MTTFVCDIEKITKRIKNEITNKSRKNRTGNVLGFTENSAVDGETWLNEYISTIAADIFSKLMCPLSRTLTDPYVNGIVYGGNSIIYSVVLPSTFDVNTVPAINQALEDTIVSYAVSEWLKDLRVPGWERDELDHHNKYSNLRSLMVRRVNLKRTYKLY